MEIPRIDLASLPDLADATGLFGSMSDMAQAFTDDRVVIIMVFVYELVPPENLPF